MKPMTYDDRPKLDDRHPQLVRLVLLCLGLAVASVQLAGCAQPAPKPAVESAPAAPRDSNLEQRLRDLQQAEALYLSGRFKEAQAAFEQLARSYPKNSEVWFRLGNTLMKQGQYDDAAGALQTAIALDPNNGRAALNLALARLAQAQAAVDIARVRLAPGAPERQQADTIDRRLKSLLSEPSGGESPR
jgi:tetratricopeptide (TPR) repeat protein